MAPDGTNISEEMKNDEELYCKESSLIVSYVPLLETHTIFQVVPVVELETRQSMVDRVESSAGLQIA